MRALRPARLLISWAVLAALALAACGDEAEVTDGVVARLAAVPAATKQAGSARAAMAFSISAGKTRSFELDMKGVVDLEAGAARMSGDLSDLPGASGRLTMIVVDGAAYLRAPGLGFGGGRAPWVQTDLASFSATSGGFTQDPAQSLALLTSVKRARVVGEQQLRGEPTIRYEGVVDPARVSDEQRDALARLGVAEIPFQAWIDRQGRLRKLELALRPGSDGSSARVTIVFELWDFGVEAGIRPPPADRVMEAGKSRS